MKKEMKNNKDVLLETVMDGIEVLFGFVILIVFIVIAVHIISKSNSPLLHDNDIETVTIIDMIKDNDKYYTEVEASLGKVYKIEISKNDFIKYKIDDEIKVSITNGNAKIIKE